MPKAYLVVNRRNWNAPPADYGAKFRQLLALHAGRSIVSTADVSVVEGKANFERIVVLEFADKAAAVAFTDQYQKEAAPLLGPVDRDAFIVEGTA